MTWIAPAAFVAFFIIFNLIWHLFLSSFDKWPYIIVSSCLLYWGLVFHMKNIKNKQLVLTNQNLELQLTELQETEKALLENKDKIRRQNEYLTSLHETALGLINRLDCDDLLTDIVQRAGELLNTPHGYIYLVEPDNAAIEIKVGVGLYKEKIGQRRISGEGLCGKVWQSGTPIAVEDYQLWEGKLPDLSLRLVHSAIGIPLKSGSKIVGVLGLDYMEKSRSFGKDEVALLSRFAELASVALDNARLYTDAQNDLTQQKLAKEALKEAEAKIRQQNEYLACLHETALSLMNRLNLTDLLETIITKAAILGGTANGFVTLIDENRNLSITKVGTGIYASRIGLEVCVGEGVSGKVWLTGDAILINDYHTWPDRLSDAEFSDVKSIIGVPLKSGQQIIGVIGLAYSERDRKFSDEDVSFLNGFAKLASIAIDNARLYDSAQYLSLHDRLTGLYNRVYFDEEIQRISTDRFYPLGVIVCDIDGLKLANDTLGHFQGDALLKEASTIIKKCFRQSDVVARVGGDEFAIIIPNTSLEVIESACIRIRKSVAAYNNNSPGFPLSVSIGYAFTEDSSASIHSQLKKADDYMYREKLHRKQSTRSAIVQTLKKALEARDFLTEGHADRLQDIVADLGQTIGLPEHQISDLRLLAQFHDIGKVGIPDNILFKKGSLTPEEFNEMRRHSEIGYRIAHSAPDLAPIAHCILKHHEWWNGQGYPLGLSGEDIPLECRILAIADAYDAMTSDRPYRKALPIDYALNELKRCSGTQFDPYLVNEFINHIQDNIHNDLKTS